MDPYLGLTVPLPGPLHTHAEGLRTIADLGYTNIWSAEGDGADAFTPLAYAAAAEPRLGLGTAIVPAFTRGPAILAQSAAAMADAAPGRFILGIGAGSKFTVQAWNGIPFDQPYRRVRDTLRFLRDAFSGERISQSYDTFEVDGFRLTLVPEQSPPVYVAALREKMLQLGAFEADGVLINWLSPTDVQQVAAVVNGIDASTQISARVFVTPSEDAETVRDNARRAIAGYLNVPTYAEYQRWLGRGDELADVWGAWEAGDRKASVAAVTDALVDQFVGHGTYDQCRAWIQKYVDNGVTEPVILFMPYAPFDYWEAVRELSPSQGRASGAPSG